MKRLQHQEKQLCLNEEKEGGKKQTLQIHLKKDTGK